jgi:hypothetical protein
MFTREKLKGDEKKISWIQTMCLRFLKGVGRMMDSGSADEVLGESVEVEAEELTPFDAGKCRHGHGVKIFLRFMIDIYFVFFFLVFFYALEDYGFGVSGGILPLSIGGGRRILCFEI